MDCPLCDYKGLGEDTNNCPSCNADLSAYRALDAVEVSMNRQKRKPMLFLILFIIAFVASIAIFIVLCVLGPKETDKEEIALENTEIQAVKAENNQLVADLEKLKGENARLKEQLSEARKKQLVTHVVKKGETLFIIAEKYFGDGNKYMKLAADNHLDDPDMIFTGTELIILK